MWPEDAQLIVRKSTKIAGFSGIVRHDEVDDDAKDTDVTGGIICEGKLGWLANRASLEIISVENGEKFAVYNFDRLFGFKDSYVSCVVEIPVDGCCILAVGLQLNPVGGKICLISVHGSVVLGSIDLIDKITSCCFIEKSHRSILRLFDGCLAVGTDQNKIILLDLCLKRCRQVLNGDLSSQDNLKIAECHIVYSNIELDEMAAHHRQSKKEGIYFGIQLEVPDSGFVLSVMYIPLSLTLVVGLDDGRMYLYDLEVLEPFHLAYPPEKVSPLVDLTFVEPADDPRACIYVWALHASPSGTIGVMHSIMFERKFTDAVECIYKNFISCCARLTMPFHDPGSVPVMCRSITKCIDEEEELKVTLFSIVWATSDKRANLMIFDLNQWYKEQMPELGDWRRFPSYTAAFPLGDSVPMDLYVNERNVIPFNSIQRPEEHFYPNSLRFTVAILGQTEVTTAYWPGLQKKILDKLVSAGSAAILEPSNLVQEMAGAALSPQYQEFYSTLIMSLDLKREFLLSIALEYNLISYLKNLALTIADGSHIGSIPTEALGLSTMTDWLWARAMSLKEVSNNYCVPLFDYSGRSIDAGIRKTLTHCTCQMRAITDVMETICTECKQYIPANILKTLENQLESMRLSTEYQETVQWLLNIFLLPEGLNSKTDMADLVPYPHHIIAATYRKQRRKLRDRVIEEHSSKYVYIDNFIELKCDGQAVRELWGGGETSALYPPTSLQKLLRILLLPGFDLESKHVVFIYLFMDINYVLGEGRYGHIVRSLIKFPSVFKMDSAVIKITQAFWYLDHGEVEKAVENLVSPMNQDRSLEQWQRNFLISTLLKQELNNLALRVLRAPGIPVEPKLEVEALLANDLISEAFMFQRAKGDASLLIRFFEGTMKIGKRELLLDLSLNEVEAKILVEFLEKTQIPFSENMHFVYLLQRAEFVDAVSMIDRLLKTSQQLNLNAPREILTIYHKTLEPTTRQLTYMAYSHPEKLQLNEFREVPAPLSSSLIKRNGEPAFGLYHRSIMGIKEAGGREIYEEERGQDFIPFIHQTGLGLFAYTQKTQTNNVVYPVEVKEQRKRPVERKHSNEPFSMHETQNPRKRTKFDESAYPKKALRDYDVSIFDRFNDTVKPSFNFTEGQEVRFTNTPEKRPPPVTQLTTPVVQRVVQREESPDRFTPHSILKTGSLASVARSTTPLSQFSRKSFESEEKSIRFAIPGSLNTTMDTSFDQSSSINKSTSIHEQSSTTLNQSQEPSTLMPSTNQSMSEVDEFYSPEKIEGHEDLTFLSDAPQPRPSIHSADESAEQLNNSSTPIKSKKPHKDLTRMVLEANTKRNFISEIFGETSKNADETLEPTVIGMPSDLIAEALNEANESCVGDVSALGNSYFLSNDSVENDKILKELATEPANESSVNITNESAFRKILDGKSGFLSTSGEYEDSRDDCDVSMQEDAPNEMVTKEKKPSQVISLDESDNENQSESESSDGSESESRDRFAQPTTDEEASASSDDVDRNIEEIDEADDGEEEAQEDDYVGEEDDESVGEGEEFGEWNSREEFDGSAGDYDEDGDDDVDEDNSKEQVMSESVICLDSSEEGSENEDKHFKEIADDTGIKPDETSAVNISSATDELDTSIEENQSNSILHHGLIMTHGESVFSEEVEEHIEEREHILMDEIYGTQEVVVNAEEMPSAEPPSQESPPKVDQLISDLLYGDMEEPENEAEEPVAHQEDTEVSELLYDDIDPLNVAIIGGVVQTETVQVISNSKNTRLEIVKDVSDDPTESLETAEQEVVDEFEITSQSFSVKIPDLDETASPEIAEQAQPNAIEEIIQEKQQEIEQSEPLETPQEELEQDQPESVHTSMEEPTKVTESEVTNTQEKSEEKEEIIEAPQEEHKMVEEEVEEVQPEEIETEEIPQEEEEPKAIEVEISKETEENVETETEEIPVTVQTDSLKPEDVTELNEAIIDVELPEEETSTVVSMDVVQQIQPTDSNILSVPMEISPYVEPVVKTEPKMSKESIEVEISEETPQMVSEKPEEKSPETWVEPVEEVTPPKKSPKRKAETLNPDHDKPSTSRGTSAPREFATFARKLRARAVSVDQTPSILDSPRIKRSLRAASVPKSIEIDPTTTSNKSGKKPAEETPKDEEIVTSPRKIRRISTDSNASTPARRTRKTSVSSDVTPNVMTRSASRQLSMERGTTPDITTPRRITRAASRELSQPKDTPIKRPPPRRLSTVSKLSDDAPSESSVQSSQSLQVEKAVMVAPKPRTSRSVSTTPPDPSPPAAKGVLDADYTSSRRLTRRQLKAMERNMAASGPKVVLGKIENTSQDPDTDDESGKSVASTSSGKSKRSTRSQRKTKAASVKSSTKDESEMSQDEGPRTRGRKRKMQEQAVDGGKLEVIPEEQSVMEKKDSSQSTSTEEEKAGRVTRKRSKK